MAAHLFGSAGLWASFALGVVALLALDLGVLSRSPRDPTPREALGRWAACALLAIAFGAGVFVARGARPAGEFFTAYLVEQALSVDNLFVMMVVFASLGIGRAAQRRVLVLGILGAAVLRGILIFAGAAAIARVHLVGHALGALLVVSGLKLLREATRARPADEAAEPGGAARGAVRLLGRLLPVSDRAHGDRFTVVVDGVRHATVLLVALVTIEVADLVFALDSIPAALGVSTDPFVVLTSNVFAVLGLRSLYFALAGLLARLRYLKHGLAAVLVVVGAKMLVAVVWAPPIWMSLAAIAVVLGASAALSLVSEPEPVTETEPRKLTDAA